jgi:FAD synthase
VGSDFRFGKNRRGDISAMRTFGAQLRFDVHVVPPVRKKALIVSSSLIRELLRLGHLGAANAMLGRHYFIEGDVVRGEARGEDLGFPTANIETPNEIIPRGVFLTLTEIEEKKWPSLRNGHSLIPASFRCESGRTWRPHGAISRNGKTLAPCGAPNRTIGENTRIYEFWE